MESISSSKNSHRTGWSIRGENTSRMPPRRANWPTPSTCWQRVYPADTRRSASSFRSARAPTSSVSAREWSSLGGSVRAHNASAVATVTAASPRERAYSAARRLRSQSREAMAPGRSCHSRPSSTTGSVPSSVCRSPRSCWASRSSPQTNTAGRSAARATAAPTQERCTGCKPVTATGQPPSSTRRTSSATSGMVWSCLRNCSIVASPCKNLEVSTCTSPRRPGGRWGCRGRILCAKRPDLSDPAKNSGPYGVSGLWSCFSRSATCRRTSRPPPNSTANSR